MTATTFTGDDFANIFSANPPPGDANRTVNVGSNAVIAAEGGNDVIDLTGVAGGSPSFFTVAGAAGQDSIVLTNLASSVVYAGLGNDTVQATGTVSSSQIQSNQGGNNLFDLNIVNNSSSVTAGGGNDTITAGAVSDTTIAAGAGNDSIRLASVANGVVYLGSGNDALTVTGDVVSSLLQTGSGTNRFQIDGTLTTTSLNGGSGADRITTGAVTSSTISGGAGADVITVNGGLTNATVFAGTDNDTVTVTGAVNNSLIQSGSGNNRFVLDANQANINASLVGGSGADVLAFSANANAGATDTWFQNTQLQNITALSVVNGTNIGIGRQAELAGITSAVVETGAGATTISAEGYTGAISLSTAAGRTGNSSLIGGGGNDTLTTSTGSGISRLTGGLGVDTFVIAGTSNHLVTDLGAGGADVITVAANAQVTANQAGVNYTTTAASSNNGRMTVNTGDGGVTANFSNLAGTNGITLNGGDGADVLTGTSRADTITGGAGADQINLGAGANRANLSAIGAAGVDRDLITSFNAGAVAGTADVLNLFNSIGGANLTVLSGTDNFASAASIENTAAGTFTAGAATEVVRVTVDTIANATDANSLDGTNLLDAQGAALEGAANGAQLLFTVGITGGGTAVYYGDAGADAAFAAAELTLVAVLDGVNNADLVFSNFANGALA